MKKFLCRRKLKYEWLLPKDYQTTDKLFYKVRQTLAAQFLNHPVFRGVEFYKELETWSEGSKGSKAC